MRVIVCGGRMYTDSRVIYGALLGLVEPGDGSCRTDITIVHGDAPGADRIAARIASQVWGLRVEPHPAQWQRWGKLAGHKRNQRMVDAGADLMLAFPGGRGTADCIRRAERAGIPVDRVSAEGVEFAERVARFDP